MGRYPVMTHKALKKTLAAVVLALGASALVASVAAAQTRVTMFEAEEIVGEVQLPSVQIFVTRQIGRASCRERV